MLRAKEKSDSKMLRAIFKVQIFGFKDQQVKTRYQEAQSKRQKSDIKRLRVIDIYDILGC